MPLASTIGLVSATRKESGIILRLLKRSGPEEFYLGKTGRNNIVHVISGMGKTNASHAATLLIERFSPRIIINFGIGGAYPSSGLRAGDIAIADKEIYGDEGLWLKDGFHTVDSIGIPFLKKGRRKYFNEFPLHSPIPPLAMGGDRGIKIKSGAFVTISASTGTNKRAKELEKRFNAICENMEGAAVAHVCAMYGIPMLEVRGISNIVEDRDRGKWDIKTASENCQKAVLEFLKRL
ncbi:MAG: purine phosphorylase family protein 1 [Nitrospirae bacterium]|nr:MAG: purine phosphorylase family protein 1 [Nitrospirota bacterium]